MSVDDRAYLSIAEWPSHWSEDDCIAGLTYATGLDPYNAELAVRRGVPGVVAMIPAAVRADALSILRQHRATALAPTREELETAPDPVEIKGLARRRGDRGIAWLVEPWRARPGHEPPPVLTPDVFLMVRASLRSTRTRRADGRGGSSVGPVAVGFMVGGVMGAAVGAAMSADGAGGGDSSTSVAFAEMLDLYTTDGRRLRITDSRFDYDAVLGRRAPTARENLDALTTLLQRDAPSAILDTGFADFRFPPDLLTRQSVSTSRSSITHRSQHPAFEFYSAWAWLLYCGLTGRAP